MHVLATPEDIIASRQLGAVPLASGGVVFRLWQRAGMDVFVTGTFSEWTPLRLIPEPLSVSRCRGTGMKPLRLRAPPALPGWLRVLTCVAVLCSQALAVTQHDRLNLTPVAHHSLLRGSTTLALS